MSDYTGLIENGGPYPIHIKLIDGRLKIIPPGRRAKVGGPPVKEGIYQLASFRLMQKSRARPKAPPATAP